MKNTTHTKTRPATQGNTRQLTASRLTENQREAIYSLGSQPALRTPIGRYTLGSLLRRGLAEIRHEYEPGASHARLTEAGRDMFRELFV